MPDEKLPPLIQEIQADASKAISEQGRFVDSTRKMADYSVDSSGRMRDAHGRFVSAVGSDTDLLESHNHRAGVSFGALVGGLGLANLAADAVTRTLEGLHKVIETGIDRAKEDALINGQLAAGIQSTGGAAGTTVAGMDSLAESIARMSGQTADSIGKTESLLLTFTNIRNSGPNKIFDDASLAAANMAARMGGDASQQAIRLGRALNDPVKGVTALTRVGVQFTTGQKDQIKAMVAAGDTVGAQKVILAELNKEFGNSAQAAGQTLPGAIARAKESFAEMSGKIVSSFLPAITPIFSKLVSLFQDVAPFIEKFGEMVSNGLGKVGPLLAPVGAAVMSTFKSMEPFLNEAGKAFAQLGPVIGQLLPPIMTLVTAFSPVQLILKGLAPVFPEIVGAVVTLASALAGALSSALQAILPTIEMVVKLLASDLTEVIRGLMPVITILATVIGQVLAEAMTAIAPLLKMAAQMIGMLLQAVSPLIPPIMQLVQAFIPLLAPIAQLVGTLLTPLIQLLMLLLQPILELVRGLIQMLVPALQLVVTTFTTYITPVIRDAQVIFQGLSDFLTGVFTGNWSRAWQGIQQIFSGVWDGIKNIASGSLNGVIDLVNGAIGAIDQGLSGLKSLTGGAINLSIPKIPHVSFDVGTNRVPGADGAPLAATVHGGEAIASNQMLSGAQPMPPRIVDAVHRQDAQAGAGGGGGNTYVFDVDVTQTNPSADELTAALGFYFRTNGG